MIVCQCYYIILKTLININTYFYVLGIEFKFQEMPVGGAALDLAGVPLPEETLSAAKKSNAVLLGAIGG